MKDNRKTIQVLVILTIMFTVMGGSLAYWNWNTTEAERTNVVFTVTSDFSCAADGGGDITSNDVMLVPTTCTDTVYKAENPDALPRVINREIKVTPALNKSGLSINMDLWLNIDGLSSGVANSENFKYALTTVEGSCTDGIIAYGNFKGLSAENDDKVNLLQNRVYNASLTDTYYLYIWLDKEETSTSTMNQTFSFSLGGNCTDNAIKPEAPVLDDGMIPVTIANDGTVTTVSEDDSSWYDYDKKQWANVVLVNDTNRDTYLSNLSKNVTVSKEDILAYYVWIPRYKYRIPNQTKDKYQLTCSDLVNPTYEEYPECFELPYVISDEDRQILINFIENNGEVCEYYYSEDGDSWERSCNDLGVGMTIEDIVNDILSVGFSVGNKIMLKIDVTGMSADLKTWISHYGLAIDLKYTLKNEYNIIKEPTVDIVFESKDSERVLGDAINTYYSHPAFWWDNDNDNVTDDGEMLAGIWVGKFETNDNSNPYSSSNEIIRVLPNVVNYASEFSIIENFNQVRNMSASGNIYGLSNSNSHLSKNSEWGAVAYLSQSSYGKNMKIQSNRCVLPVRENGVVNGYAGEWMEYFDGYTSLTGCLLNSEYRHNPDYVGDMFYLEKHYGYYGSYPQSTTGNISGIFDMEGGLSEYVMGHYNSITGIEQKYYDVYTSNNISTACNGRICYGHTLSESDGWYNLNNSWINSSNPYIIHNSIVDYNNTSGESTILYDYYGEDISIYPYTYRTTIINGFGE